MKTPDKYLRTAYVSALKDATGLPVYAKAVPAGANPSKYIIIDSQSKSQIVKAKVNYFEWQSRININIYNVNPAGVYRPVETDDIEESILGVILYGVQIEGFYNKNTDLISTQDLSLDYPSRSVDRKLLIFEHWLSEKEHTT